MAVVEAEAEVEAKAVGEVGGCWVKEVDGAGAEGRCGGVGCSGDGEAEEEETDEAADEEGTLSTGALTALGRGVGAGLGVGTGPGGRTGREAGVSVLMVADTGRGMAEA